MRGGEGGIPPPTMSIHFCTLVTLPTHRNSHNYSDIVSLYQCAAASQQLNIGFTSSRLWKRSSLLALSQGLGLFIENTPIKVIDSIAWVVHWLITGLAVIFLRLHVCSTPKIWIFTAREWNWRQEAAAAPTHHPGAIFGGFRWLFGSWGGGASHSPPMGGVCPCVVCRDQIP